MRVLNVGYFLIGTAVSFVLGAGVYAHTGNLRGPNSFQSTTILPKKIFKSGFQSIFSQTNANLNANGVKEGLGAPLSQSVSIEKASSKLQGIQKTQILALAQDSGISAAATIGTTQADISVGASVYVPQLNYGLSERFSVGIAVPVYQVSVNTDLGFSASPEGARLIEQARAANPVTAREAVAKLNSAVNSELESFGYDPIQPSRSVTQLGDVTIGGKYLVSRTKKSRIAIKPTVTLPTGKKTNIDQVDSVSSGDGQMDIAAMAIWDYQLFSRLRMTTFGGMTVQLPDRTVRRIPTVDSSLSSDKEAVYRNLGDKFDVGASFDFELFKGINLLAGYSYQAMRGASFDGNQFDQSRYRLLEEDHPAQSLHAASLSASLSTVSLFRRGQFFAPITAVFTYSHPFAGKNVPASDVISAELVAYF